MTIISEMHVKLLGLAELDILLSAIERNLAAMPTDVRQAYSLLVREKPRLSLVSGKGVDAQ